MEDFDYIIIIGVIYIINCIFLLLINIGLSLIHIKEPFFLRNFFMVIFFQIILETLTPFFLLIYVLTILISKENAEWHLTFHLIINYTTISDIMFNIIILIYLIFRCDGKKNENSRISNRIDLRKSIEIEKYSFKFIHIISLSLGLVHTVILLLFRDKNNLTIKSFSNWFYFFCPIEASIPTIFIFTPFLVLFAISIPYKFVSTDTLKVTNYVHLNHFCINCMILGILGIVMPIVKVASKNLENSGFLVLIFSSAFFLLYLNCLCLFRFNCMYIDNLLDENEKGFFNKIKLFFNLMLCRKEVPKPNFIDFNNTFIEHSLAYESDFKSDEIKNDTESLNVQG